MVILNQKVSTVKKRLEDTVPSSIKPPQENDDYSPLFNKVKLHSVGVLLQLIRNKKTMSLIQLGDMVIFIFILPHNSGFSFTLNVFPSNSLNES